MKLNYWDMPKPAFIYAAIFVLANRLQALGDKIDATVTTKQWLVLALISKFTASQPCIGEIAELLGTSRQNIKKIALILEKKGLLKMQKDKMDMRYIKLQLTPASYKLFDSRASQENEYLERVFHGIDETTQKRLCEGLTKLLDNIERIEENENH